MATPPKRWSRPGFTSTAPLSRPRYRQPLLQGHAKRGSKRTCSRRAPPPVGASVRGNRRSRKPPFSAPLGVLTEVLLRTPEELYVHTSWLGDHSPGSHFPQHFTLDPVCLHVSELTGLRTQHFARLQVLNRAFWSPCRADDEGFTCHSGRCPSWILVSLPRRAQNPLTCSAPLHRRAYRPPGHIHVILPHLRQEHITSVPSHLPARGEDLIAASASLPNGEGNTLSG